MPRSKRILVTGMSGAGSSVEPLLRATCTHEIDAARPLAEVVRTLVAIAGRSDGLVG